MIRDTKLISRFIVTTVLILTVSHRSTGGGSWKRLERLFVADHDDEHWDENRIIFPDMIEDSDEASWRSTTHKPLVNVRPCEANCPVSREYSPVCGTNGVTYQNMGMLQCAMRCGVDVDLYRPSPCSRGPTIGITTTTVSPPPSTTRSNQETEECIRKCPSTPEYNPVCGSNLVTYSNEGKLRCAQYCGVDVHLWRRAPCPNPVTTTTTPATTTRRRKDVDECIENCPTTTEYNPVCGTDDETYYNIGKLNCAKMCGVDVDVQNQGRCSNVPSRIQFASIFR